MKVYPKPHIWLPKTLSMLNSVEPSIMVLWLSVDTAVSFCCKVPTVNIR